MYQKGTGGLAVITEAGWSATDTGELVRGPTRVLLHNFRTKDIDRDRLCGFMFYAASTCLPDVPKKLVSVVTDSLPSLAHGAIGLGSGIHVQWNPAQCEFVGIGLVLFQLTSEWNWLAGAPW
jgi:hypothetical protein